MGIRQERTYFGKTDSGKWPGIVFRALARLVGWLVAVVGCRITS